MKTFFTNKILIILLFSIVTVGSFAIIRDIYTTDVQIPEKKELQEQELLSYDDIMKYVDDQNVSDSNSKQLKYGLRADENEHPLGYVDSTFIRCFVDMGTVDFLPHYKYKEVGGALTSNRLYGFSIPLVGDLNGDGKPEIVALGYNGIGVNESSNHIYVFNGQTGEVIVKFTLPATTTVATVTAYHGSPSQLALVDADRNGKGEIIFAFNYSSSEVWRKKIVSWEVNERTFDSSIPVTENSKLTHKWTSSVRYDDASNAGTRVYDYPMPQVVDIDGDGVPEVIVYNKVYSALTGNLLVTLESLGTTINNKTAYIGSSGNEIYYNEFYIAFPMIYDIDGDGKYDYLAGGKIYYDINPATGTYKILDYSSQVKDGRTAVADVNGDGKPDIVVTNYPTKSTYGGVLQMTVWNPDFANNTGEIIAQTSFNTYNSWGQGNHSYIFIGDIDGKQQNGKKYPEISILTARPYMTSRDLPMRNIPVHPNVTDGGITTNMNLSDSGLEGVIISFTWDNTSGLAANERLKVSFMLEHDDRSVNTGFTLFDFDNDGVQDICYRDEQTLRIISAKKSYIKLGETSSDVIRFKQTVWSFTGYEYPVIADVDGDASADMIVMGRSSGGTDNAAGYIFAIEGANRDLAPAPKVWNQYMYSPLKINEDLTTPKRTYNPLSEEFSYYKDENDTDPVYIYNNTITQVPIYSVFEAGGKNIAKPIVRTPDAELLDLTIDVAAKKLNFKLTNKGDATVNPLVPINIYQEGTLKSTLTVGSGGCFIGDTLSYSVDISDPLALYTITVGGTLGQDKETLIPNENYNDCNWADNIAEIATFLPKNDAVTVVQYGTALIDVLGNDVLLTECSNQKLTPDIIVTPMGTGVMSGDFGSIEIVGNKLLYTAPKSYEDKGGVVEMTYTLTCNNIKKSAKVYIYIVESCNSSFATCLGTAYQVCVKEIPQGVTFSWYDAQDNYLGQNTPYIPNMTSDMKYYIKPSFNKIEGSRYRAVDFPKGELKIHVADSPNKITAKWIGEVDTDWNNPANWVHLLADGSEQSLLWAPMGCVDVIISSDAKHYPELTEPAACGKIHMEDRALIKGIHLLTYESASVDFTPVATEKDRFVMWSAPLKDMYSGDYHFPNISGMPDWGQVYMNFFQSSNPDVAGSVARDKTFTATFGTVGQALPLGTAFNVKVMPDKKGTFTFPKNATSYTDANGNNSGNLARTNSTRFITDGISSNGVLSVPVSGNNEFSMIQVVNPFMAYLDIAEFFNSNSTLERSYKIWNGDVNADFITVLKNENEDENGHRYVIDDTRLNPSSAGYIAPLQSFFVTKTSASTSVTSVTMNASMTRTTFSGANGSYVLRSADANAQDNILRIKATSGDAENSTVLLRKAGAQMTYSAKEDAEKGFMQTAPVSVYTLTSTKQPLAINVSENFEGDVKLGLRLSKAFPSVTLSFEGLSAFGQSVKLIDHELGNREIDLRKETYYTFAVNVTKSNEVVELNNRFSLRFSSNPTGVEDIVDFDLQITASNGQIEVESAVGFDHVDVVNVSGARVYYNDTPAMHRNIPVPSGLYIVKVMAGDKQTVRKVIVNK